MESEDPTRRRWTKGAPFISLGVLVVCALAIAAMYVQGGRTSAGVVIAAGLPVVLALALVAAAAGWRRHTALRLVLVVAVLASQAPLLDHVVADGTDVADDTPRITVTTLNTRFAGPTDAELVDLADGSDVLALQEWAPERTEGLSTALGPQWHLAARDHDDYIGADVVVWVRRPWRIADVDALAGRQPGSSVHLTRGAAEVTISGTRLQNPAFLAADRWGEGLDSLRRVVDDADGPVIVLGDLNAPPSAVAYRRFVERAGLRDCTAQLGSGFPGTWGRTPGSRFAPVPIDHVLTADATCTELAVTRERGSDHRALTATVALG